MQSAVKTLRVSVVKTQCFVPLRFAAKFVHSVVNFSALCSLLSAPSPPSFYVPQQHYTLAVPCLNRRDESRRNKSGNRA